LEPWASYSASSAASSSIVQKPCRASGTAAK
jgi:hypothetical protein